MKRSLILSAAVVLSASGLAFAQETGAKMDKKVETTKAETKKLVVGDAAPALSVEKWVKGAEITGFEKGRIYVVEFWATWCGPCIASMPHLSELQKQYAGKGLTIIGVTSADERNTLEKVQAMVADKGETMGYTVAWDTERKTSEAYMKAAGKNGIPCAFVVDQKSNIAYIGHPARLDIVLEKVIDNTWDYTKGPQSLRDLSDRQNKIAELAEDKPAEALKMLADLEKEFPSVGKTMMKQKYAMLMDTGDKAGASAVGNQLVAEAVAHKDSMSLNEIAWNIVDPEANVKNKDLDLAMKAATEADRLTNHENGAILDTLARVYFLKGDTTKAIELQTLAVAKAEDDMKAELEKSLDEYKKAKH